MTTTPPPAPTTRPLRTDEIPPHIRELILDWCARVLIRLAAERLQAEAAATEATTGETPKPEAPS